MSSDQQQQQPPRGPFQDGGDNKPLVEAMSVLSLTNICFKKCVMKSKAYPIGKQTQPSEKTAGVLEYLKIEEEDKNKWILSEKETVCMHNCSKSYVELKGFMHTQLLKDYSFVRKKNRKLFENL